jgi:hypothetical protein
LPGGDLGVPDGTQIALLRSMLLIDASGQHSEHGTRLESIRSLPQLLTPNPFIRNAQSAGARWLSQGGVAAEAKTRRSDWGALRTLWRTTPR